MATNPSLDDSILKLFVKLPKGVGDRKLRESLGMAADLKLQTVGDLVKYSTGYLSERGLSKRTLTALSNILKAEYNTDFSGSYQPPQGQEQSTSPVEQAAKPRQYAGGAPPLSSYHSITPTIDNYL